MGDRKVFNVIVHLDIPHHTGTARLMLTVSGTDAGDAADAEVYATKLAAKMGLMRYYDGVRASEGGEHVWPKEDERGS